MLTRDFSSWYKDIHGYEPFPWQNQLADTFITNSLPDSISVPTGTGKTSIIALWHWASLQGLSVPKRLIYIVDRRLIVDSVTDYAVYLGCDVIKMRGGVTIDDSWLMEPQKPKVIVSTVDQVGSRLLWRGYGVSPKAAPIHAALIGNDALLILDEAHISTPFAETVKTIQRFQHKTLEPWHFITMTATPFTEGKAVTLTDADRSHPILMRRLSNHKLSKLRKARQDSLTHVLVEEAKRLMELSQGVVAIICNTTIKARQVFNQLSGQKVLLTGRIRPFDKDTLLETLLPNIICGSRQNREPLFVVATQTIEVGADLDFDALVTQNAPFNSLQQRFGRLDRLGELGESPAVIVHEQLDSSSDCPIYGKSLLQKTWSWLNTIATGKGKNKVVDFGINGMEATLQSSQPPIREPETLYPLTEEDIRKLRQTIPQAIVDIEPWLHGSNVNNVSVQLVWREDLQEDSSTWLETVNAAPPVIAEMMPCSLFEVKKWIGNRSVLTRDTISTGRDIRPGDIVIIPSDYGGYGKWGWEPASKDSVKDIGNQAGANFRIIGADEHTDIEQYLKDEGVIFDKPIATPYLGGLIIREANIRPKEKAVLLSKHLSEATEVSKELTDNCIVHQAVQQHDIGKQDARFQVALGASDTLLAKSSFASPYAAQVARQWSGLPFGWRHEVASVAMLPKESSELLRYLIATHHGYGRSILPLGNDVELWEQAGGARWGNMTDRLNTKYGAWGLAYLESLVRLSDWIQSKREQERGI
ncbi:type I-G CRISPR-associated helicase/endonuclease Cas3g [Desulfogranum marinum]|uniref:type I-G CRISPR-associated helicase/endonuclease Cas3g n=1 Tax=Desulfogranum marinum TaxID=453220 RepID=UPI0019625D09|nr:type I-U CRISPR-associated helicase/endonuclease Cas3 [Desulfogranum marinum]MBM9514722.1 type I-U CRISPR-associated helicase/endonuclease Cas3 [Desulfogranum marinum]